MLKDNAFTAVERDANFSNWVCERGNICQQKRYIEKNKEIALSFVDHVFPRSHIAKYEF